jgi:hypothetical protein
LVRSDAPKKSLLKITTRTSRARSSFDKVVLVFITQSLLVGLYCVGLHNTHMPALDQLTTSRWVFRIIMQALVLAGKTDAGGGFHSEIPYWVCLHQESSSQQSKGGRSIRYIYVGRRDVPSGYLHDADQMFEFKSIQALVSNSDLCHCLLLRPPGFACSSQWS